MRKFNNHIHEVFSNIGSIWITLFPLLLLFQWSYLGSIVIIMLVVLQVIASLGTMLSIAYLVEASINSAPLSIYLLLLSSLIFFQLLIDSSLLYAGRVASLKVEKYHENKVLVAAMGLSVLEFESEKVQNTFNKIRGRELGGVIVREFVRNSIQVFSLRLLGLLALVGSTFILWYTPIFILPCLITLRLWLVSETKVLHDSVSGSAKKLRNAAYIREFSLNPKNVAEIRLFEKTRFLKDSFVGSWMEAMSEVWDARQGRRLSILLAGTVMSLSVGILIFLCVNAALNNEIKVSEAIFMAQVIIMIIPAAYTGHGEVIVAIGARTLDELRKLGNAESRMNFNVYTETGENSIEIQEASFSYPNSSAIAIDGVSLDIKEGEKVAFVGANGAGKSTLIKLICGLYKNQSGNINLSSVANNDAAHSIEYVPQDFVKFPGSIVDIVSRYSEEIDYPKIRFALDKSDSSSFVDQLSEGQDTIVGFAGSADLSGGQWQKLALAQIFYSSGAQPTIYIFDEPTSSLSADAESELFRKILGPLKNTNDTVIVASHRLGAIRGVDRIIVLDEGKIIERGTHEELMLIEKSRYRYLFNLQAKPYLTD